MKKFLTRFIIYLIPLPVYLGVIFLIDPYNYSGSGKVISDEVKTDISAKLNPFLWKLIQFDNQMTSRIILGDSRTAKIKPEHVKEVTGSDYFNFAYPGGTLVDMIETFWYADSKVKLKEVYMGINFNLYNDFERKNNVKQSKSLLKNYFSYAFSKIVVTSSIKVVNKQYFTKDLAIGKPNMDFEEFWKYHVRVNGERYYQKYKYPEEYHAELVKISRYCRDNDIRLVFFVPPNHIDWQNKIAEFHLEKENEIFLKEIRELGVFYNLDTENDFTRNKLNFLDPVHPVSDSLQVSVLWGK